MPVISLLKTPFVVCISPGLISEILRYFIPIVSFLPFSPVFEESSTSGRDSSVSLTSPTGDSKVSKNKTMKSKKRVRSKSKAGAPAPTEGGKEEDEIPPDGAGTFCESPRAQTPVKKKKLKGKKKKRHTADAPPPPDSKLEFQDVVEDSLMDENTSRDVTNCDVAKETAKETEDVARDSNQDELSENDDVFLSSLEGDSALNLLASFATSDKVPNKRKRSETTESSEQISPKKRGRPKKFASSPSYDSGMRHHG